MKKDFLTVWDLSADEIDAILNRAIQMKHQGKKGSEMAYPLAGKSVGLLFEKTSTRTRISFETGIYQLGGQPIYMTPDEIQLGRGETVSDTARTISRYLSAVTIRTHEHERIEEFAKQADIPVINALTDLHHPCQALADLLTIKEKHGKLQGVQMAYIGDGNNVANSLIEAASRMGINLRLACPEGFEPDSDVLERAKENSEAEIIVVRDPKEAAGRTDVIYTDVWVSMGQENEADHKMKRFRDYQVNSALMSCAKKDAIVMHCLPAHRGEEITAEIIDGPQSVVFDQAENRLHVQKALLEFLLQ